MSTFKVWFLLRLVLWLFLEKLLNCCIGDKVFLLLLLSVIVKEGDDFYCSTDSDVWIGNFDSWENNTDVWFEEKEMPLLLKSSLVEKVTESEPLYLEDVVK